MEHNSSVLACNYISTLQSLKKGTMPLCPLEFGEKFYDTYFECGTPPVNKETGPGGFKARESLSKFSKIVLLLYILLSDIKMLLNFARGQQAFAYSLGCC